MNLPSHPTFHKLSGPFEWYEAIYYINMDTATDRLNALRIKLKTLGVEQQDRRLSAVPTPENHYIGCALSHRIIIVEAHCHRLSNVLVLEDNAIFHHDIPNLLPEMLDKLRSIEWDLFYFGGHVWARKGELVENCNNLRRPEAMTCTHAIVYNNTAFSRLLNDLPESRIQMKK